MKTAPCHMFVDLDVVTIVVDPAGTVPPRRSERRHDARHLRVA
jgi:hypothetical protein